VLGEIRIVPGQGAERECGGSEVGVRIGAQQRALENTTCPTDYFQLDAVVLVGPERLCGSPMDDRWHATLTRPATLPGRPVAAETFSFVDPVRSWAWPPLVVWAVITVTLEAASLLDHEGLLSLPGLGRLGSVPLSLATATAALGLLWTRATPPVRFGPIWWLVAAGVAFVSLPLGWASQGPGELAGIVIGSAVEELVYRLALPVLVIAVARRLGMRTSMAIWVAFGLSTVVFTILPGHLEQARAAGAPVLLVVASMGVLWFWVVWRGGSVLAAAVFHALANVTILPVESGLVSPQVRSLAIAALVLAAVAGISRAVTSRSPVPGHSDASADDAPPEDVGLTVVLPDGDAGRLPPTRGARAGGGQATARRAEPELVIDLTAIESRGTVDEHVHGEGCGCVLSGGDGR